MFARWLHKAWKYFWTVVLSIFLVVFILGGTILGILQMRATKGYVAEMIEKDFSRNYSSQLEIGELDGLIPFNLQLSNVYLLSRSESTADTSLQQQPMNIDRDTLAAIDRVRVSLDIWSLLQNRVSITGFSVHSPRLNLSKSEDAQYLLIKAFQSADPDASEGPLDGSFFTEFEIVAPEVEVEDGTVYVENRKREQPLRLPSPLIIDNINTRMFLEVTSEQLFWDIENFGARVQNIRAGEIHMKGQVYNDDRFLEFNAFQFSAGSSRLNLNGEIENVSLYRPDLLGQLRDALYNIDISSDRIVLNEFSDIYTDMPDIPKPIELSLNTEGLIDSLWVDQFTFGIGDSYFDINGFFQNMTDMSKLSYRLKMADVVLQKQDVELLTGPLNESEFSLLNALQFDGSASGTADTLDIDLDLESPNGSLAVNGGITLDSPYRYSGSLSGRQLNLSPLLEGHVDSTRLNFDAFVNGSGLPLTDAVAEFNADVYESSISRTSFDSLSVRTSLVSGFLELEYDYVKDNQTVQGSGWGDFTREVPRISLKGNAENINLADYFHQADMPSSGLTFDYNMEVKGLQADRMHGRANLDVKESVINGETVRSHQLYMDLDSPDLESRTFRLTSSVFDMTLSGTVVPTTIIRQVRYWTAYLRERYQEEVALKEPVTLNFNGNELPKSLKLEGSLTAKDLSIIRYYVPQIPELSANTELRFNVNADGDRLLMTASTDTDSLAYKNSRITDSQAQITASFRSDRTLKEFATIDLLMDIGQYDSRNFDMDSIRTELNLRSDSLTFTHKVESIAGNARMNLKLSSMLYDSTLKMAVSEFYLGNESYSWQNEGIPEIIYDRANRLSFQEFNFRNQNELLRLQGTMSPSPEDSVLYQLRNINLARISDLLEGSINFDGRVNGTLVTRSLTRRPSIEGELNVTQLSIRNRLIGDALFQSQFDPASERFNTQIRIVTDSTKYGNYLANNDQIGQDILLDGYFIPPDPNVRQDTTFYFDAELREVDMWVVPLITSDIFETMEGKASGQGYITGNYNDFDFHADFEITDTYAKPRFLKTDYYLDGPVTLDREKGVVIDRVRVRDTKGGTGLFWGTVDLNNFNPVTYLDLNLRLNRLQFLHNDFGPDVPFYGSVSGTGEVKLTGPNTDLLLQTTEAVTVTPESELSIPLMEETELDESGKFIRFVEEFDPTRNEGTQIASGQGAQKETDKRTLIQSIGDLTFKERFNLDLQFNARQNMNVNLIFDPITGEILSADGAGQLRITMQDEEVQMFGRYNINGGSYRFVSGEILSRRLSLESGGSIVWEGDPENARLDIQAVYNARPNLAMLNSATPGNAEQNGSSQRVPIDLVIEITGTVSSVENDFYFRLSNNLDVTSNSTLSLAINQINRDEQQKFLQATSILLTGEFIPSESYGQATASLSQSLSRGSAVINPLLSNQVISPLLSNQINALLNSDVSRFDIDFNLNAYNEIDLGIALRLYNDRLILRREGQLTGSAPESTLGEKIGDLNATYRITNNLSVTAFHRQDQTLGSVTGSNRTGDVTPSVDGVGLEARVQFNTWKELKSRIGNTFKRFFGVKDEDDKEEKNEDVASGKSSEQARKPE